MNKRLCFAVPVSRAAAMLSSDRCCSDSVPNSSAHSVQQKFTVAIITTRSTAPRLVKPPFKPTPLQPNRGGQKRSEITWLDLDFLFARPVIFFLLSLGRRLLLRVWIGSNCSALKRITAPQRQRLLTAVPPRTRWNTRATDWSSFVHPVFSSSLWSVDIFSGNTLSTNSQVSWQSVAFSLSHNLKGYV